MLLAEIKVRILSVIVGSILSALGIINNDVYLIIAAIVISPIATILNDLSKDIITFRRNKSIINISLLLLIVMCAIAVGIAFGKMADELSEDVIKQFKHQGLLFNSFIGLILGMFTAYIRSFDDIKDISIESQLVGIGVAITLLPPIVDIGLRLGQESLDNGSIKDDLKISLTNGGSFLIGAIVINYFLLDM